MFFGCFSLSISPSSVVSLICSNYVQIFRSVLCNLQGLRFVVVNVRVLSDMLSIDFDDGVSFITKNIFITIRNCVAKLKRVLYSTLTTRYVNFNLGKRIHTKIKRILLDKFTNSSATLHIYQENVMYSIHVLRM